MRSVWVAGWLLAVAARAADPAAVPPVAAIAAPSAVASGEEAARAVVPPAERPEGRADRRAVVYTWGDGAPKFVSYSFGALKRHFHHYRTGEVASAFLSLDCDRVDRYPPTRFHLSFDPEGGVESMGLEYTAAATRVPYSRTIRYVGRARYDITRHRDTRRTEGLYWNRQGRRGRVAIHAVYRDGRVVEQRKRLDPPPPPAPPDWAYLSDGRVYHRNRPGQPFVTVAAMRDYLVSLVGPIDPCPCGVDHTRPDHAAAPAPAPVAAAAGVSAGGAPADPSALVSAAE